MMLTSIAPRPRAALWWWKGALRIDNLDRQALCQQLVIVKDPLVPFPGTFWVLTTQVYASAAIFATTACLHFYLALAERVLKVGFDEI